MADWVARICWRGAGGALVVDVLGCLRGWGSACLHGYIGVLQVRVRFLVGELVWWDVSLFPRSLGGKKIWGDAGAGLFHTCIVLFHLLGGHQSVHCGVFRRIDVDI